MKRIETHGGIGDPAGEVEQSVRALSSVRAGIAAIRWRADRESFRRRRKRKAGKRERDEKETTPRSGRLSANRIREDLVKR